MGIIYFSFDEGDFCFLESYGVNVEKRFSLEKWVIFKEGWGEVGWKVGR